jgi:hypothetical protein
LAATDGGRLTAKEKGTLKNSECLLEKPLAT